MSGLASYTDYAVVVLAGGTSRRMGGDDKTALELGAGRTVLDHLVGSLERDVSLVVVGHQRLLERVAPWVRESPPLGGPLAGLGAGVAELRRTGTAAGWTVLVAGDQPFAADGLAPLLAARTEGVDVVLAQDPTGRDQPLLAAYRTAALEPLVLGELTGRSMRSLVVALDPARVARAPVPDRALLDIDDSAGLLRARAAFALSAGAQEPRGGGRRSGLRPAR